MKLLVIEDEAGNVVGTVRKTVEMREGHLVPDGVILESGQTIHEVEVSEMESLSPDELHKAVHGLIHK